MANELKLPLNPFTQTGLTLLGKVYNDAGSQVGSTVNMSEDGPAIYIGDFPLGSVADGQYMVRFETNTPDALYGVGMLYVRNNLEVSQETFFNPTLDTVTNVTNCANNADMRGTDGANTVAPDNAGISANGTAIGNLNNFNPAVDQVIVATNNDKSGYSISGTKQTLDALNDVADTDIVTAGPITTLSGAVVNVDTVDTCTSNSDMRGTDGANTVIPDNSGISSNGSKIDLLETKAQADIRQASIAKAKPEIQTG